MEKFINSFDSILKISVSWILYTFKKAKSILENIYLIYSLLFIFSLIGLIISIKYAGGLVDLITFFPFLFLTIISLISLAKIYQSHKKSVLELLEKEESELIFIIDDFQEEYEYYTHKKNKTKNVESKLNAFYKCEGNKYFDVEEYDEKQLIEKLYNKRNIAPDDKILLNDDLMNLEIRTILKELKTITGIPMNKLDKLFMRFCVRERKYVNVNSKTINSSDCQANKVLNINKK